MFSPRVMPVVALGCSLVLAAPAVVRAQDPVPRPIDLADALRLARQAGPLRQVADARRQIGLGRVTETNQWANPSIEWRRENLGSTLLPDIFATVYLPIDVSGKRLAQRQAAAAGRDRVAREAEADRRTADLEVARAWMRATVAQGHAAIIGDQVEALREIARVDAERLKEGQVSEAVGLRTSLEA
ncbi:hypothetical protein, partial [Gemmatimonas sp.]